MSNQLVRDGAHGTKYVKATGEGTNADPYIPVIAGTVGLPTGAAQDGTDITTPTAMPSGGVGIRGWLSAIWTKLNGSLTAVLGAGTATVGKFIQPGFSISDSLVRPANATPYAATQSINVNLVPTNFAYTLKVVTLTVANSLAVGDRITVAGCNTGYTAANVDGDWIVGAGTDATQVVFTVATQPTGTTPQAASHGSIAKCLSFSVADAVGNGIILSRVSVSLPGIAMTGAIRAWLYTAQPTVLVDQSTFTLLAANDTYRKIMVNLYPVTEGAGSTVTFAEADGWWYLKPEAGDTRLYMRLCTEGAGTPTSAGTVTARLAGVQLLG
jgi:hypothetical protein